MSGIVQAALSGALMLSATTLELASMNAPALAQTLNDWKCTGNPDIPSDEQIVGCTNAIKSGRYQTKTFRNYVERSVAASFGLSDKLLRAKDFQDVLRIQTEFFQTQLKALTEQSKDLCGTATKAASDVTHVPIK